VASAGGVWSALAYGFGGFRDHGGRFAFDPRLPAQWSALTFRLTIEGTRVRVTVRQHEIEFVVEDGVKVELEVRGEPVQVSAGTPVVVKLSGQGPQLQGAPLPVAGRHRSDGTVIGAIVPGT
jgi:alpha,alpha-trehalose phosphorylase